MTELTSSNYDQRKDSREPAVCRIASSVSRSVLHRWLLVVLSDNPLASDACWVDRSSSDELVKYL